MNLTPIVDELADIPEPAPLSAKVPKPTKAQLRAAVLAQLRKTGMNRKGRRALLAQVKRKARR